MNRPLLFAAFALTLGGCPTLGDSLPDVPLGEGDAQVLALPDGAPDRGLDPLDAERPDAAPRDAAPDAAPVDAGPPDATCPPGAWLGPCVVCGDDGEPTVPEDDDACPEPDCETLTYYAREDADGYSVCWADYWFPVGGRCRGLGDCHDDPLEYCVEPITQLVAEVAWGACQWLDGCEDDVPADVRREPEGEPCNGVGMCTADGACTANPDCDGFVAPGPSFFCAARDGAAPYCEFYLEDEVGIDCASFCGQHGWRCAGAWNSMVGMCVHEGEAAPCGDPFQSFVCRCAPDD